MAKNIRKKNSKYSVQELLEKNIPIQIMKKPHIEENLPTVLIFETKEKIRSKKKKNSLISAGVEEKNNNENYKKLKFQPKKIDFLFLTTCLKNHFVFYQLKENEL